MAVDNFWEELKNKFKKGKPEMEDQMGIKDEVSYELYDENGKLKQTSNKEEINE